MINYGLIGKKLGHSFSARFFNDKFDKEGIPSHYDLFEIENIDLLPKILDGNPHLRGFNVTIPYKEEVMRHLDMLSIPAREIGAVNCVKIIRHPNGDRYLFGHNSDSTGFMEAIRPLLGGRKRALVLGTGGASKAIVYALQELRIEVTPVSRTHTLPGALTYDELTREVMDEHDIIVNCTPLGTWPDVEKCPDIPYQYIDSRYLCFDLVYNPEVTEFMKRAADRGAATSNGYRMLVIQALEAYLFWNTEEFISDHYDTSLRSTYTMKRMMSRQISVSQPGRLGLTFYMAIADVWSDPEGKIFEVKVRPFMQELAGTEYADHPLHLHLE